MPTIRYLLYTLGLGTLTGYFVWSEISSPGSLDLLVFDAPGDRLGTSEYSPVEMIQPLMLMICGASFAWIAWIRPSQRPVALLLASIALACIIRELDLFLDRIVADNFWQVPVAVLAALSIVYTYRHRRRFSAALLRLWPSPGLTLLYAGALIQFVFAQLIGHEPLWQAIAGDGYQRIVKVALEELIELVGYFLWLIGAVEYAFEARALQATAAAGAPGRKGGRKGQPQ